MASASAKKKTTVQILRERLGLKPSEELMSLLRKQTEIRTKIIKALKTGPKTVPEISKETGLEPPVVFWYLMTMHKYGLVHEDEKTDEGYFRYKLAKR